MKARLFIAERGIAVWQPKLWKNTARKALNTNCGRIVAACVLVSFLVGGLSFPAPAGMAGAAPGAGGQLQAGHPAGKAMRRFGKNF